MISSNFTKIYDFDTLNIGSGLISSMATFTPSGYLITPVNSGIFNGGSGNSNYIFTPSGYSFNPNSIKVLTSSGDMSSLVDDDCYVFKLSAGNPSGDYTVYGPYPNSFIIGTVKYNPTTIYAFNLPSGQIMSSTSGVSYVDKSKFLAEKIFEINPDQESKLRARFILNHGVSPTFNSFYYENLGKCFYSNTNNVFSTWSPGTVFYIYNTNINVYDKLAAGSSNLRLKIDSKINSVYSNCYTYNNTASLNKDLEVNIPAGTEEIKIYVEDTKSSSDYYYRISDYNVQYNDLRVQIDTKPSIPIYNSTIPLEGSYINYASGVSLSIDNNPVSGYYNVILGQYKNGQPVDYFVVGDAFQQINYSPIYCNRNIGLKFPTIDLSSINLSYPIELWIDIIDIVTEEAENIYYPSVSKSKIKEFFKSGDNPPASYPTDWPRRLKIKCSASTANSLPSTPSGVSTGPSISAINKNINYNAIVGGLYKINITELITQCIVNGQSQPIIWLSFSLPNSSNRGKYVSYNIGNSITNKPRIVYTPSSSTPTPSGESGGEGVVEGTGVLPR